MLFQMAASVSQVGFGHLADRWRPRLLLMIGPIVAVTILSFVGRVDRPGDARGDPDRRRPRRLRRSIRRRRRSPTASVAIARAWRCRCTSPAGRWGSRWVRCSSRRSRSASDSSGRRCSHPRTGGRRLLLTRVPPIRCTTHDAAGLPRFAPYARPLGAALLRRRAADDDLARVRDVHAGDADAPRHVAVAGGSAVAVYLFAQRGRRIPRRPGRRSLRPRRVIVLSLVLAMPFLFAAPLLTGWSFIAARGDRRVLPAVDAAGQRHVRPGAGAGERGDGVIADDGLRLGQRRIERPDSWDASRIASASSDPARAGADPAGRAALALLAAASVRRRTGAPPAGRPALRTRGTIVPTGPKVRCPARNPAPPRSRTPSVPGRCARPSNGCIIGMWRCSSSR